MGCFGSSKTVPVAGPDPNKTKLLPRMPIHGYAHVSTLEQGLPKQRAALG